MTITIYRNPKCSESRAALELTDFLMIRFG